MYERFTDKARKVMQLANEEAQRLNHQYIGTEHILLGLVRESAGVAANVLKNLGIDLRTIRLEVERFVVRGPDMVTMGKLPQTPKAKKVIEYSIGEARNLNHNYVGTEHLLLGLLREQEGLAAHVLTNLGLKLDTVRTEVVRLVRADTGRVEPAPTGRSLVPRLPSRSPTLDRLGDDLTEFARQGKLDPVVGRSDEIHRLLSIVHRRSRRSAIVLGEVGVGKTALVEGLAQALVDRNASLPLTGWRVVRLDLTRMLAGTRLRGHLEERLEAVLSESRRTGRMILFLDDLHLWAKTPRVLSHLALGRDPVQPWIATATPAGYEQLRGRVESLAAFFQPLIVRPLARAQALEALRQLRDRYEAHHHLTIQDDALQAALDLTAELGTGVRLDVALSILDEAAADVRLTAVAPPPEIRELDGRIEALNLQKEAAVADQDFDLATRLRDEADQVRRQKEELARQWREQSGPGPGVDRETVTRIFRRMHPAPVQPDHIRDAGP
jgi:ATP-dependent Clp protease ATP-binding subunit ClpC